MSFNSYHFHIYFKEDLELEQAQSLVDKVKKFDFVEVGRVWNKPVGPHPMGSCQITVNADKFEFISAWFMQNRGELDLFVHALSGDDIIDHTQFVCWIGHEHKLNLDFFEKLSK